ncbi:MAG TPA: UvrD-helicase domain-containing protein, partial [Candidatus Stercoripulliclostridium merdigallinarum]|nr:UvrD-helicase domain-containing protein [Candidatus Stercoripulliclostridium merdigallinarum]
MDSILENLNETQRKIVTDTEGAVLVLAGAGSGKTRVLTHRVAYIVKELGVPGWNILAITFTNKATAEMRERLEILLGPDNGVWVSTFHSFSASMLRKFADKIGFKNNFSIYDETDSKRVIAKAMRELHIDSQQLKDVIKEHISRAKNAGMDPDEYFNEINGLTDFAYDIKRVYERYNELLTASNAMDFDDLLHRMKEVLTVSEEALQYCRRRFRYIHVDEFQDTNKVQYEIVKLIAGEHGNIFVVGDDDQSIYGWRGAEIKNILNFDKEFPDAKVYKLVENYRSTPEILEAANKLIHYNTERHEKSLVPIRKDGAEVTYFTAYNDLQEADWVIDKIRFLMARYGYRKSDFAILVRATSLTRLFESALAKIGMKYRVLGGIRFYDRKEILDTLAYMRLISNNADNEALERIINVPQRGIGEASVQKIRDFASERGLSMFDAVLSPELPEQLKKKVQPFAALIGDLLSNSFIKLGDFVEYLIEKVGFERYYTSTGSEEEAARWDNVKEFLSEVKQFEEKLPDATLNDFLQTVTLVRDDEDDDPDRDKITVATMH